MAANNLRHFTHVAEGERFPWGTFQLLAGLSYWLGVVPLLFRVMFRLAWAMQTKCAWRLLDYIKSLPLLLPGVFIFGAFLFLHSFLSGHLPHDFGSLTFALITMPLAALVWRSLAVPVPRHSMRLAREPHAEASNLRSSEASPVRERVWETKTVISALNPRP